MSKDKCKKIQDDGSVKIKCASCGKEVSCTCKLDEDCNCKKCRDVNK